MKFFLNTNVKEFPSGALTDRRWRGREMAARPNSKVLCYKSSSKSPLPALTVFELTMWMDFVMKFLYLTNWDTGPFMSSYINMKNHG